MKREDIKLPFFSVSPKAYLYGDELLELAHIADELAAHTNHTIIFTAPPTELHRIAQETEHLLITAQHVDPDAPGNGMGDVPIESLRDLGIEAAFINHAAHPVSLATMCKAIEKMRACGVISVACVDTAEEARVVAGLGPDIILAEPSSLIGTGTTSSDDYVRETMAAINAVDPSIIIMEGAGIHCGDDVRRLVRMGAQGTGISSGIAFAEDKRALLQELFSALD